MAFDYSPDSIIPDVLAALFWLLVTTIFQAATLWRLRPQHSVGDESEYLAALSKTRASQLWVRVPLFYGLALIAESLYKPRKVVVARILVSLISAATVGLAVGYTQSQAGFSAGLSVGIVLLASVERMVLAIHIWPDTLLGLWSLLFMIVAIHADGSVGWAWLGMIAALGFLTRLDFVVLSCFALIMAVSQADAPLTAGVLVIAPTLVAALVLILRNGRIHGIWRIDTTISFNLRVSTIATQKPNLTTSELMQEAVTQTQLQPQSATVTRHFAFVALASPPRFCCAIFARVITLLGQETFVRQNLDQLDRAAYVQTSRPFFSGFSRINLTYGFLVVFVFFVFVAPGVNPTSLALIGTLLAVQSAFQTRSRYRMSIFPLICSGAAISVWGSDWDSLSETSIVLSGLLAFGVSLMLVFVSPKRE